MRPLSEYISHAMLKSIRNIIEFHSLIISSFNENARSVFKITKKDILYSKNHM
jgi:hypothetical protein